MEILKHGKRYKTGITICQNCDCEFLYDTNDINEEYYRVNAYESTHTHDYVRCPECGYTVVIKIY